ncbi:hypothetical protein ADICYQ_2504 [Cyclobacterium qasimii M12-11B]|uniref:Uncharacterized protein n=1 Tax=Cyclobacterium qasimii M12-11B TaxID=641524 RepID=S7WNW8_9BACT|nr:hypothetical protein ADICYQ_2504 [Cyclobacterium qasimii M12-11B]
MPTSNLSLFLLLGKRKSTQGGFLTKTEVSGLEKIRIRKTI